MRAKRGIGGFLALLTLTAALSACAGGQTAPDASAGGGDGGYPLEMTDMMSRTVKIEKAPQRVVSLTPSNTEIVCALGAKDRLVGVDDFSDYPPEVSEIAKVGDYSGPNIEAVLAQNTDLVLASNKLQAETIQKLEGVGLTVVAVEAWTYDEIVPSIEVVAKALGVDAKPVVDGMRAAEEKVKQAVKDAEKPTVYFAVSFGDVGNWTVGKGSFVDDIIEKAGGVNVTRDGGAPWMEWNLEQLLKDDPQVILVSGDAAMAEAFKADPAYAGLSAVKNGKVFAVDANISSRPGPRIVQALEDVAKALHPDRF